LNPIEPFKFLNRSKQFEPPPRHCVVEACLSAGAAAWHCSCGPPVSHPPGSLVARHGAARARRPGIVAGRTEPPVVTPTPSLLLPPPRRHAHCPPSLFLLPRATEPPSKQNAGRRPVPLSSVPKHVAASPAFTGTWLPASDAGAHRSSLIFIETLPLFALSVSR
jgi:hypothetical protein